MVAATAALALGLVVSSRDWAIGNSHVRARHDSFDANGIRVGRVSNLNAVRRRPAASEGGPSGLRDAYGLDPAWLAR